MQWTSWRHLDSPLSFTETSLAETLDGGQAFRWNRMTDGNWQGLWGRCVARVRLDPNGYLEWSSPLSLRTRVAREIPIYWAAAVDFPALVDRLPWRSDAALAAALARWKGLRILRQPLGETLFTFLCSSTKQIVQIKQICEMVATRFGVPLGQGFHALPSWKTLNAIPEEELRKCKTGFRARYIKQTAQFLARQPDYLDDLTSLPYFQARKNLFQLPGVGEKIADCILLFGARKLEAFPVDVWMLKAMTRLYGLHHWKPGQVAQFGRAYFGPYAGLAQQYLFAGERRQ